MTWYVCNILQTEKVWYIERSIFRFFQWRKEASYQFRPHGGKSVAYIRTAECVCEFVFTRQGVDVTDVLFALSYDVCHFIPGGCRATDLKWLSRQNSKRRGWRSFHRSRVPWCTDAKWFFIITWMPLDFLLSMLLTTLSFLARVKIDFKKSTMWQQSRASI